MIQLNVIERLSERYIKDGIITREEQELFTYGLGQGLIMLSNMVISVIIGLMFGMVWQSIIYMLLYIPIRSYAGGYHSRSQIRCFFLSIILITAVLWGIKYLLWTSFICLIISLIAGSVIFILSPLEDSNKPLEPIEVIVYKKRVRIILLVELCLLVISLVAGWLSLAVCICMALVTLSLMLFLSLIVKKFQFHNEVLSRGSN